ncbi:hypothetical protein [Roseateles saccharophilus]|uniref:Acid shock protein n=1 Tax=Roseateles saccharophilus TaxID=304 RepID=A0A4R3VKR8_ROSSA|nr:hypothetical protein [Roseateles saccharophilus]TCV04512.1 hypothetical protein EV671_1001268 [Roseateles saccharophilus]
MKTLLTAAALALAFAAPAAEARVARHHTTSHATSPVKAQAGAKKATKAKHKKHVRKGRHKKAA